MNDPDEILYAFSDLLPTVMGAGMNSPFTRDFVKEQWAKVCVHIACFSNAELPSQWERYANKGTGCAIGFDQCTLKEWCLRQRISLFPTNYDRSRQEDMIRSFRTNVDRITQGLLNKWDSPAARKTLREKATKYLFSLAMTVKTEHWREEGEWRILMMQPKTETLTCKHAFTSLKRDDGVCYFALPICLPSLVTEVVIGPRCSTDSEMLKRQLNDAGLSSVSVRQSSMPVPALDSRDLEINMPV
jgi:hypothetical protein